MRGEEAFRAMEQCAPAGAPEHRLSLAGLPVLLKGPIEPAWEHLPELPGEPRLRIEVWSGPPPPRLCGRGPQDPPTRFDREFGGVMGSLQERFVGWQRPDLVAWMDRRESRILAWRPGAPDAYSLGKPFYLGLLLWHRDLGLTVGHAGLVASGGRGLLLAGPSGCGKTSCALACIRAGWTFLGDDCVAFRGRQGFSLYRSAWVERSRFVFPEGQCGHQAPICGVVLPRFDERTSLEPVSPAEALLHLAPGSLLRIGGSLEPLADLVSSVPCFRARLRSFDEAPAVLETIANRPSTSPRG